MTRARLERKVKLLGMPENYYSLEGRLVDGVVLEHPSYSIWRVFRFELSRGSRHEEREFDNEEDACDYAYSLISIDSKFFNRYSKQ